MHPYRSLPSLLALSGALALSPVGPLSAAEKLSSTRTPDGTIIHFPNGQKAKVESAKGLLGPENNPSSQVPLTNREGNVVVANEVPATKTSTLHIYVKGKDGKFVEIKNAHDIVIGLQPRNAVASDYVRATSVGAAKKGTVEIMIKLMSAESGTIFPSGVAVNLKTNRLFVPEGGD
jgi:hypothetical protein